MVVGKVSEIPPGHRKLVTPFPGGAGIGIFNVAGNFYALRNRCPHKGGPLCTGEIGLQIAANAPPSASNFAFRVDRECEIIRCPWHQWAFEIATGRCLLNPRLRVATYPVRIDGDDLIVDL